MANVKGDAAARWTSIQLGSYSPSHPPACSVFVDSVPESTRNASIQVGLHLIAEVKASGVNRRPYDWVRGKTPRGQQIDLVDTGPPPAQHLALENTLRH